MNSHGSRREHDGSLRAWIAVLRANWVVLVAGTLIGLVAATVTVLVIPPRYDATVLLYVSPQLQNPDTSSAYQGSLLSEQRVSSYVELVTTTRVATETAAQLGLPDPPADISASLSASTRPNTVLLALTASRPDPRQAAQLADTAGSVLIRIVREIEQPDDPGQPPPVALHVVEPAPVPSTPSWPLPAVTIVLGGILGLLAGLAVAWMRAVLDNRVRSTEQLSRSVAAPIVGEVSRFDDAGDGPLVLARLPHSPSAEDYRKLRTNLQFVDVDSSGKVLAVTSALPSEGKTTTVCNVAVALASGGATVVVVDADLRRPAVADAFGVSGDVGLTSVLTGRAGSARVTQVWRHPEDDAPVHVIASGPLPPNSSELLSSRAMAALVTELRARYDYVLVDVPPVLPVTDGVAAAVHCDGVLVVCRHGRTTVQQVGSVREALAAAEVPPLGAVLTMVPGRRRGYGGYYGAPAAGQRAAASPRVAVEVSHDARPTPRPRS